MKYLFSLSLFSLFIIASFSACAQKDKSKRPSPPALVTQKVGDATISIDYSQPSIKGRTIGKDLEPMPGKVWRTGANEATVFEVDKDVMVEGKVLPKGKYGLFTIQNGDDWTIIFNKTWDQWGAFKYSDADDALRVNVKAKKQEASTEKMTFAISAAGVVTLLWGNIEVDFTVK
ncbi:MAG: DUF2911 domain-containing protein [Chitinophagaceae bacterium]|nr:DUF2911 domain-containing protein [Chitinophagaceae bacterium]